MTKLQISLIWPGCAQGKYIIKAKGFILAILLWGNAEGSLEGWGPIGYVPIDPAGNGSFFFPGRRGIPPKATHVWARCVSHDFREAAEISTEIEPRFLPPPDIDPDAQRLSILTDLHLASKPWRVKQTLRSAANDVVLLLGDNLYLNCGSVVETTTEGDSGLMAGDWKDGCISELTITGNEIEIDTRSVTSGTHFPRGYYRFQKTKEVD